MIRKRKKKRLTHPLIAVRKSSIHSNGVFAKKNIPADTKIIEYVGEKLTKAQSDKRADVVLEAHAEDENKGAVYIFELNKRYDIDGNVPYNLAKHINHSCDANADPLVEKGRIWIIALRDIKKGEEVTYNYGYDFYGVDEHECYCRSKGCVGFILDKSHWKKLKRFQEKQKEERRRKRKNSSAGKKKKKSKRSSR